MKHFIRLTFCLLLLAGCGVTNTPTEEPQATLALPDVIDATPPPSIPADESSPPLFLETPEQQVTRLCCNIGICDTAPLFGSARENLDSGTTRQQALDTFVASCVTNACETCRVQIVNLVYFFQPEPIVEQPFTDLCPFDPLKMAPGFCGCGILDLDADQDGFPDLCFDNCPTVFNPDQLDTNFNGFGDACDLPSFNSGDTFSFLTPLETELFFAKIDLLNSEIDRQVNIERSAAIQDLRSRGFNIFCSADCQAERSRILQQRDGTVQSVIEVAAASGVNLILGPEEWDEIDTFNCLSYPNTSFACDAINFSSAICTIAGPPCD